MRFRAMTWFLAGLCLLAVAGTPAFAQRTRTQGATPPQADQTRERAFAFGGSGSRIGVSIRELRDADVSAAKLTRPEGVFIDAVQPGTPAERAGIKSNDIVLEYDGERVRGARHFARLVQETPAGRAVQIVVNRGGARQTFSVTPEEGQLGSVDLEGLRDRFERNLPDLPFGIGQRAGERRIGLALTPLSTQLASYFGVSSGALVSEVVADSPAARANVKAGDVITSVNGRAVSSPADVVERLRTADASGTMDLTLTRDRREVRVQVRLADTDRRGTRSGIGI